MLYLGRNENDEYRLYDGKPRQNPKTGRWLGSRTSRFLCRLPSWEVPRRLAHVSTTEPIRVVLAAAEADMKPDRWGKA